VNVVTLAERFAQVLKEAPRIESLSHFNAKVRAGAESRAYGGGQRLTGVPFEDS
jgi:hypothetical protein